MQRVSNLLFAMMLAACANSAGSGGPECGDGERASAEQCDDGNTVSGDGCSSTCMNESGNPVCGDGMLAPSEMCDDGNMVSDDGCSATCEDETGGTGLGTCGSPFSLTLMMDMGALVGSGSGTTSSGTSQVSAAACDDQASSGAASDQIWKLVLAQEMDVAVKIDQDMTTFDSVVRVQNMPCDPTTEVAEFTGSDGCSDADGHEEFLGYVKLAAGTYYIVIDGRGASDAGMYKFDVLAFPSTCGDGELDPLEFCDDGDSDPNDGCSAKCEVESGYTCDFNSPSVCMMDSTSETPAVGDLVINEFMAADSTVADTNCDGKTTGTDDEFVEIYNKSAKTLDLDGVTVADSVVVRHTFGAMKLPPGKSVVVWTAGNPMCAGVTMFDVASTGQLGLNDTGDTIKLELGTTTLAQVTYVQADITTGVSRNRSPDLTGTAYANHTTVAGDAQKKFSPGKKADGTAF
jgi:cysteine-rich repeat protein